VKSRCVDHDEDVVVRGYGSSGLDCSTDDHLDDSIEHAPTVRALESLGRYRVGRAGTRKRTWSLEGRLFWDADA
jgi:hypothetical protein